jgi:hypothetical protein
MIIFFLLNHSITGGQKLAIQRYLKMKKKENISWMGTFYYTIILVLDQFKFFLMLVKHKWFWQLHFNVWNKNFLAVRSTVFGGAWFFQLLTFAVVFCQLLLVIFFQFFLYFYFMLALAIVLFVLRKFTSSGYLFSIFKLKRSTFLHEGCRDRMVVRFTTTYAISAYHH